MESIDIVPDRVASTDFRSGGEQPEPGTVPWASVGGGDGGGSYNEEPVAALSLAATAGADAPRAPAAIASTSVDGNGMWRSWTRVFAKPESACLDLLDNCFDAALRLGFRGRVEMECYGPTVVSIQNNSHAPIKPLGSVLTVYRSNKNSLPARREGGAGGDKDSIGENGVGLKHGCATLSDCSVVLARNGRTLEVGVIARALQTPTGVCLPSSSFPDVSDASQARDVVLGWLSANAAVSAALSGAFGPGQHARSELACLAEKLYRDLWEEERHVFLLVLCGIKRRTDAGARHALIPGSGPARAFLREVRAMLPESYINFPSGDGRFDFSIDRERVRFSHWQRRLVELTRFRASVSADEPFEALPDADWDRPSPAKHGLDIYCGFDARRVDRDLRSKKTSACALYVYSRRAGRLIEREDDARHLLGLSSSGVDYTQGLTVIVDDAAGELPLTPTKDGIAWSERTNGEVHRRNMLSWTGAVAKFFWTHHMGRFGGRKGSNTKEVMKKVIRSFALSDEMDDAPVSESMADAQFTEFEGIEWVRTRMSVDNRWMIRRKASKSCRSLNGPSTLFVITEDRIQRIKTGRKPKHMTASNGKRPNTSWIRGVDGIKDKRDGRTGGRYQWPEISQNEIPRISSEILSYLRDMDDEKLFEVPVVESLPDIKDKYLQSVGRPMDFRTIERERIKSYTSISELQEDLVLIFDNCIAFNGVESPDGQAAKQMLDRLNDAFESTDITQVTMGVLSYLRDLDEQEWFDDPVVEQNPEIKHDYLEMISNPMDFKTIEEERVNSYTSVVDLRQDLVLIFENCIMFNGADSVFGVIAQKMLESLDEAFECVTSGKRSRRKTRINYDKIISQHESDELDSPKSCSGKKRIPYNSLKKKLRDAEKQIHHLREQLAARDEHIRQLEGKRKSPARKRRRLGRAISE